MSALEVVFSAIYGDIPRPILEAAFAPTHHQVQMDERIMDEVIRKRVLIDLNATSGQLTRIQLESEWIENTYHNPYTTYGAVIDDADVYRIPPEARDHRLITGVYQVIPWSSGFTDTIGAYTSGNTVIGMSRFTLGTRTLEGSGRVNLKPTLLGGDMVKVTPKNSSVGYFLECLIAFDDEFMNITQNALPALADLVLVAVKGYIYNTLILEIGRSQLIGGQSLSELMDIVREYRQEGSRETYNEHLKRLKGSTSMDPAIHAQILAMAL